MDFQARGGRSNLKTMLCNLQVAEEDLQRVSQATGAQVQTTVNGLSDSALGTCAQFQEKQASSRTLATDKLISAVPVAYGNWTRCLGS